MAKKLDVIILNYNNDIDTIECVESLNDVKHNCKSVDIKIILVDNASERDCIGRIKQYVERDSEIEFIQSNNNLGYAGGNNLGIKRALEHGADYVCLLNNDVIVNDTFYEDSIKMLEEDESIYFSGPVILEYKTKTIQYAGGRINLWFLRNFGINRGEIFQPSKEIIECDYVGGACLFFRPKTVLEIGLLPENYFLFWEETEWCMRARKKRKKCVCVKNNYIEHKGSATIKKIMGMEEYYMERNRIVFSKRNDPLVLRRWFAILYLFIKCIAKGIIRDKHYFSYLKYYADGIRDVDEFKKAIM